MLVFSTAKDGHVYAFDSRNGLVLRSGRRPMGTEGLPAMYVRHGRQYLVVNATTPLTWGPTSREGAALVPDSRRAVAATSYSRCPRNFGKEGLQ
jgi:hypothetical protein